MLNRDPFFHVALGAREDAYAAAACFADSSLSVRLIEPLWGDQSVVYRLVIDAPSTARDEITQRLSGIFGSRDAAEMKLAFWNGAAYQGFGYAALPQTPLYREMTAEDFKARLK